jgi:hypothetical protein
VRVSEQGEAPDAARAPAFVWPRFCGFRECRRQQARRTLKTSTATPGMERHRQNLKTSIPNLAFVRCLVTILPRPCNLVP